MRVLHILAELKPSGAETMLHAAAPVFAASGVDHTVLSTGNEIGVYAPALENAGFRILHLPLRKNPAYFFALRRLIAEHRFEVVHIHREQGNFLIGLAALAARPHRCVRTIHNVFAFTGWRRWLRKSLRLTLHHLGVRHISIGESVSATELRDNGLATQLIWNWYDDQRFTATTAEARQAARKHYALSDTDFVLALVGNCSSIKNHRAFFEALANMPDASRIVCLHAGIEEPDFPERRQCAAHRLDRVRFLGRIDDVLPVLRAADAYVMPSLKEGMSIAAIEALATGLPGLLTDVDGLRDFRKIFPAIVYCKTQPEAMRQGLEHLLHSAESLSGEAQANHPSIASRVFRLERGVAEYLSVYR